MILGLPLDTLVFLWLGALAGGIAAGGSGFAFGLATMVSGVVELIG